MTSLYDFSVSGVAFGTDEGTITADDYLGSGVVATDYSSEGIARATQNDEGVNFIHSIDQSILGDDHTISFSVAPSSGTFAQSIASSIAGWDGTAITPNGIQFDIGNYYRGQWGDVVDGFGEVDGLDLDLPWNHSDSISSVELTYSDGYVINVDMPQTDEVFPEAMDEHTEHDEIHYTPTLHFNLTEPETGRSFGDAVSAVFTETFDVPEVVEANGEVRLYQDGYDIHVQDSTGDWHDVLGRGGNAPQKLIDKLSNKSQGWQLSSAETVDGLNELLFVSSDGSKSRIYECDEDWDIVTKNKRIFKGKKHGINEDEHQIDLDGDGEVEGSNSYDLGVFFVQADVDPATESISFVGSTSGASDAGSGKARDANGKSRYKHFVNETLEDNILTVEKTVMPAKGKTFYESIKEAEKSLTSWDGTAIATNALQFDFGNVYNGQWGIGEVDGIDFDRPWDHADSTSTYTLTFEDGNTLEITHDQSESSFTEDGVADWDELHFSPIFAFDLRADESDSDPDGLKLGDAVSVTFKETYVLADMIESDGSVNAAITLDGGSYVQDEDNVWHDITGAADEITNHVGVEGASSRSIGDWLLSGAETINGVNQLVYSSVTDVSSTINVVADEVWDVVEGSATTVLHSSEDAISSLESQFGTDFDGDSLVSGISSFF